MNATGFFRKHLRVPVTVFALAIALVRSQVGHATIITGTFKTPDGININGQLLVRIPAGLSVKNTCTTPSRIVPSTAAAFNIVNGAIVTIIDLVPSDCLSLWTPYDVQLLDNNRRQIFRTLWYVSGVTGTVYSTAGGNQFLAETAVMSSYTDPLGHTYTVPVVTALPPAPIQTSSFIASQGTIPVTGSSTMTVTLNWSRQFVAGTTYTAVCSVFDSASPLTDSRFTVTSISALTLVNFQVTIANSGSTDTASVYCRAHGN